VGRIQSNRFWLAGIASAALGFVGATAPADESVVYLRSGGQLIGELEEQEGAERTGLVVRLADGTRVALGRDDVDRIDRGEQLEGYHERAAAVAETAADHYQMSRWCWEQKLYSQSQLHARRAIALDPEHSESRAMLGYVKSEGKWWLKEQLQAARGLVRFKGEWRLPEQADLIQSADQEEVQTKQLERRIRKLRAQWSRGGDKAADAINELQAIDDPRASSVLAGLLATDDDASARAVFAEVLSRFQNIVAVDGLTKALLEDPDPTIREQCADYLDRFGKERAVGTLTRMLKDNDNGVVNRAGSALALLPDPRARMPLVDALRTKHTFTVQPSSGVQAGFNGNGNGGFSAGGKPQKVTQVAENPEVLNALGATLDEEVNYGYDQEAWRAYFADRYGSYRYDMRRDL
jgi:hypothetical protein